jgi:hypothetical protein
MAGRGEPTLEKRSNDTFIARNANRMKTLQCNYRIGLRKRQQAAQLQSATLIADIDYFIL